MLIEYVYGSALADESPAARYHGQRFADADRVSVNERMLAGREKRIEKFCREADKPYGLGVELKLKSSNAVTLSALVHTPTLPGPAMC